MHEKHGLSVSVCMATYNGRAFIEAQLDSILPQLSKYDELVVSDNSSTDGTWELLQAYQKKINESNSSKMSNLELSGILKRLLG